jgi:hypothetical protein
MFAETSSPPEQLAHHGAHSSGGAVEAERGGAPLAVRGGLDGGQHLGEHQGGRGALGGPGQYQDQRGRGEAAGQRGHGERGQADDEQPAPAEGVAEPAAEDQQQRVGDAIGGDHQFQRGRGGVQGGVDGG